MHTRLYLIFCLHFSFYLAIICIIFFVVFRTVLMLVKMVVEYCQCVTDIPSATPELLTRLVDLLKVSLTMMFEG